MASLTPQPFRVMLLCLMLWAGTPALAQGQEEAEALPPEHIAFLYWQQGYMYHQLGEYESAIDRYSRAIDILPTAEAYTFRGWSMSKLGRLHEAIGECKEAIRVNGVAPGLIDTEIHASAGMPNRVRDNAPSLPMGRAGTAEEVAEAARPNPGRPPYTPGYPPVGSPEFRRCAPGWRSGYPSLSPI